MILNTTYDDRDFKEIIDDCLGYQLSFLKSLKIGGVGSKRMIVEDVSQNFSKLLNKVSDLNYGNIELRPNGILVRITKGLENYTWVIPYRKLVIYKAYGLSIHAEGEFIRFKDNRALKENKNFFKKMIRFRAESQEKFSLPAHG